MKLRVTLCVSAGLATMIACSGASSTLPADNGAGSTGAGIGSQTQTATGQVESTGSSATSASTSTGASPSSDAATPPPPSSTTTALPPATAPDASADASTADASSAAGSSGGAASSSSASSSAAVNLITNGDFADATNLWTVVSGTAALTVTGGQLCATVAAGEQVVVGWSQGMAGVALAEGSYTFSYEARVTRADVTIMAAIGSTRDANAAADLRSVSDDATTTLKTFTHQFTTQKADPSAGLTFTFTSGDAQSVCFADVSLTAN